MRKRNAIILAAVAFVAVAGIAALVARHYYRKLVASEYYMVSHYGSNFLHLDAHGSIGPERKARWRWALREQLEGALKMPYRPLAPDSHWGIAYAILKDPGWEKWSFTPEMDDATRKDMIRYLCWRLEDGRSVWGPNDFIAEFRALSTYPPETLAPHSEMLERALDGALASPIRGIVGNAQQFVVSKLGQEWADETARKYLRFYSYRYDRGNALASFFLHAGLSAQQGNRAAQELHRYFVQLSRGEPDYFQFDRGPMGTAQAALKRIEAAGWAPSRE